MNTEMISELSNITTLNSDECIIQALDTIGSYNSCGKSETIFTLCNGYMGIRGVWEIV